MTTMMTTTSDANSKSVAFSSIYETNPMECYELLDFFIEQGDLQNLQALANNNSKVFNFWPCLYDHILFRSSEFGQLEIVKWSIKCGAKIDQHSPRSPLETSAQNGHIDVVKCLLEHNPQLFVGGPCGDEVLAIKKAYDQHHLAIVDLLVRYSSYCPQYVFNNTLISCVSMNLYEHVVWLIEHSIGDRIGASLQRDDAKYVKGDIHFDNEKLMRKCAQNGHLDILKYLVEKHNANIHILCESALRSSAEHGHVDVVEYLIQKGADIHAINNSAFLYGAMNNFVSVIECLVRHGQDPCCGASDTAMSWCSQDSLHLCTVEYLLKMNVGPPSFAYEIDVHTDHSPLYTKISTPVRHMFEFRAFCGDSSKIHDISGRKYSSACMD